MCACIQLCAFVKYVYVVRSGLVIYDFFSTYFYNVESNGNICFVLRLTRGRHNIQQPPSAAVFLWLSVLLSANFSSVEFSHVFLIVCISLSVSLCTSVLGGLLRQIEPTVGVN